MSQLLSQDPQQPPPLRSQLKEGECLALRSRSRDVAIKRNKVDIRCIYHDFNREEQPKRITFRHQSVHTNTEQNRRKNNVIKERYQSVLASLAHCFSLHTSSWLSFFIDLRQSESSNNRSPKNQTQHFEREGILACEQIPNIGHT